MTAPQDTSEIPAVRPGDDAVHLPGPLPWYRDVDRGLGALFAGLLVLTWSLTDVGPAVLAALVVVMSVATVRRRAAGVVWWTVGEVAVFVAAGVVGLVLVHDRLALPGAVLAVQLVVGAAVGAGLMVATAALRRRRA